MENAARPVPSRQDVTEKDLVLVGQSVTVEVDVTKAPKSRYVICTISAPKLTVATEGGGTLASSTGTGTFTCTWTNDGTVVMPELAPTTAALRGMGRTGRDRHRPGNGG